MGMLGICKPVIASFSCVLAQIIFCRYMSRGRILLSWYAGALSGLAVMCFAETLFLGAAIWASTPEVVADLIIYACFIYCYFHFLNMGQTARRIRILRELKTSPGGLTMQEMLSRYDADEIIDRRIQRLVDNGQAIERDGRYYMGKPVMALFSILTDMMKAAVFGRKDGVGTEI